MEDAERCIRSKVRRQTRMEDRQELKKGEKEIKVWAKSHEKVKRKQETRWRQSVTERERESKRKVGRWTEA